jgi:predicted ATPase
MGHWLDSHDLDTVEKFGKDEMTVFQGLEGEGINDLLELAEQNGHITVTKEARDFAKAVQGNQDHFMSWKDSFNSALPNEMLIKERIWDNE